MGQGFWRERTHKGAVEVKKEEKEEAIEATGAAAAVWRFAFHMNPEGI
jgi:hypothetical protein